MRVKNLMRCGAAVAVVFALQPATVWAQAVAGEQPAEAAPEEIVVTGSFLDPGASSATKLNAPVRDIPLAITSYSDKLLTTLEAANVSDVFRYMTGVQRSGNTGTDITLRGFRNGNNDRNSIMTDGLPGLTTTNSPSTASTDHIEVVRGPASILYGQAQPGGFVNIISKKPLARPQAELEIRFDKGVGSLHRAAGFLVDADTTGPLDKNGEFSYRLIGEVGLSSGFRDFSQDRPVLLAPSIAWSKNGTSITVLGEYRRSQRQFDSFLVAPGRTIDHIAPPTTSYHEDGDYTLDNGKSLTVIARHELSRGLALNGSLRYVASRSQSVLFEPVAISSDLLTITRRARQQDNRRTFLFGDINLSAKFEALGIGFRSVFGVSRGHETSDFNRLQFFNGPASGPDSLSVTVLNPVHGAVRAISTYPLVNSTTAGNLNERYGSIVASGVYMSSLITFSDQFKGMVGLRYAREDLSVIDKKAPFTPVAAVNDAVLPMGGLIYQPSRSVSFYASYSTSFAPVPATTQDASGNYSFKPTTASSVEGGIKLDLFDNRLSATASYFDITKRNTINLSPCTGGQCGQQVGEERSNGIELEINARPAPNFTMIAGISRINPRVTKSLVVEQVGANLANSAKLSAQAFGRYDLVKGPLAGFGLGVGVAHTGSRPGLLPTATLSTTLVMPAYTLVDAGLYYKRGAFSASLKVNNLLDERYYESAGFSGEIQVLPGTPRNLSLVLRQSF